MVALTCQDVMAVAWVEFGPRLSFIHVLPHAFRTGDLPDDLWNFDDL